MRLLDIRLTKFGACEERALSFGDEPGLVVVYGPNEAGKSTTLAAVSDFLFGVHDRSPHAALFGGDALRISATIRPKDGEPVSLVRRKGRTKTLMDAAGVAADESLITRLLGGTTRSRFETLFGLDHERLRSGGDSLLSVEGDIGRLIVEAGGGLRSLVDRLAKLDQEIDQLFDIRRSANRRFYQVLDAFEGASAEAKAAAVSVEVFERQQGEVDRAQQRLDALTARRIALAAEAGRMGRLLRVAPILLQLDQVREALSAHAALPDLADDFEARATAALQGVKAAKARLEEAIGTRDTIKSRLDALPTDTGLAAQEAAIRDAAELATHAAKAREDRPAREAELATTKQHLARLQSTLGLGDPQDLAARLPSAQAIGRVQTLASSADRRSGQLEAASRQVAELQTEVEGLAEAVAGGKTKRFDQPSGIRVTDIAAIPTAFLGAQQRRRNAEQDVEAAKARAVALGFDSPAALGACVFPTSDDISLEMAARERLAQERSRQLTQRTDAESALGQAEAALDSLMGGPEIATDEALKRARTARADALAPLRAGHLAGRTDTSADQRLAELAGLDSAILTADEISDRHAAEAQRAAALGQALRSQKLAQASRQAAIDAAEQIRAELVDREAAWQAAFPDAAQQFPQLARLRAAADERAAILKLAADAEATLRTLAADDTALQGQVALLELAEKLVGEPFDGSIAERANRAIGAVNAHDQAYEAYRRLWMDHQAKNQALEDATRRLATVRDQETQWRMDWDEALAALGLEGGTGSEEALESALAWASAGGLLMTLETTQRRLDGMDRDERALKEKISALAKALELTLPDDLVAAGKMLESRLGDALLVERRRSELEPDLHAAQIKVDRAEADYASACDERIGVCSQAGLADFEEPMLAATLRDQAARLGLRRKEQALLDSLASAGDGASETDLRDIWQGRDLDVLRAEEQTAQEGADSADQERNAATETFLTAKALLSGHRDQVGATAAEARREAATAELHDVVERYVELSLARDLIKDAIETVRKQQQDPMIVRAGELFSTLTRGAFKGIGAEVDSRGQPAVVGERSNDSPVAIKEMSDGTRDQLYLAFRLAGLEEYARVAEPLPFVADDILVHFDDDRSAATLDVLAEFALTTQVLLFTHHKEVEKAARALPAGAKVRVLAL